MSNAYAVFLEEYYYNDFLALYASWKYYDNKVPIKVYIIGDLPEEKRNNIKKYCKVYDVPNWGFDRYDFYGKQLFKYIGLLEFMEENEIIVDADTLFLSNLDFLFDYVSEGKVIGASEAHFDTGFIHKVYCDYNEDIFNKTKKELKKFLDDSLLEKYNYDYKNVVINGGLIGFNKTKHSHILKKTIEILTADIQTKQNIIFDNEQYMVNFLISLYNIDFHLLPHQEWMNTWGAHKTPKKIIKIEEGKLQLYNEGGSRINFYHFTGGIGMPMKRDNTQLYACRNHFMFLDDTNSDVRSKDDVEKLWFEKFENTALLLYKYFNQKGHEQFS